ncbi:hypothetical protein JJC04_02780 [Flavobacterium covae]|nr:hypothetical protein [Flavobacterium covae]QYS90323.1 hypothetical protein JJC04_09080 [Flavobacterium covae]QYS91686.1 hypothetical protein JJC04_02780 [Flavobacterium covae]
MVTFDPFNLSFNVTLGVLLPEVTVTLASSIASIVFLTSTIAIALSQFIGLAPFSQISYSTWYVPLGVVAPIVMVPSVFNVKPAGTFTPVRLT